MHSNVRVIFRIAQFFNKQIVDVLATPRPFHYCPIYKETWKLVWQSFYISWVNELICHFSLLFFLLSSLLLIQLIWDVSNNTRSVSNWSVLSHEGDDSLMGGLAYPPAATPLSSLPHLTWWPNWRAGQLWNRFYPWALLSLKFNI